MAGKHRKRKPMDPVEPDLPITPMLDMSFQLMAFFIITFRPQPTEAQIMLALPKQEGGATALSTANDSEKPVNWLVRVHATDDGKIGSMTLVGEGSAAAPVAFGADSRKYLDELKRRVAAL